MSQILFELTSALRSTLGLAEDSINQKIEGAQQPMDNPVTKTEFLKSLRSTAVVKKYQQLVAELTPKVAGILQQLNRNIESAQEKYADATALTKNDTSLRDRVEEKNRTEENIVKRLKEDRRKLDTDLTVARKQRSNMSMDLYGTSVPHEPSIMTAIALWIGLAVIALSEIAINIPVFQLFGDNMYVTIGAAFSFGILIAMMADAVAVNLRKPDGSKILAATLICIMAAASFVAGMYRNSYLQTMGQGNSAGDHPIMLAILNFLCFAAAVGFVYGLTEKTSKKKEQAYRSLSKRVKKMEKRYQSLSQKIDQADAAREEKYRESQQGLKSNEAETLGYKLSEQKLLDQYNAASGELIMATEMITKFHAEMDRLFRREIEVSREILKAQDPSYKEGPMPEFSSANFWERSGGTGQTGSASYGLLTQCVALFIFLSSFLLTGCGSDNKNQTAEQQGQRIAFGVMYDRTDVKFNHPVSLDGVLDSMGVMKDNLGSTQVYGKIYLTAINERSVNEVMTIDLPAPKGFIESPLQRRNAVSPFLGNLASALDKLNSLPAGATNTSIWRPFCNLADKMNQECPGNCIKKIVIGSDMMENYITSFYKKDFTKTDDVTSAKNLLTTQKAAPNLQGFEIIIVYSSPNTSDDIGFTHLMDNFWVPFLKDMGAQVSVIGKM